MPNLVLRDLEQVTVYNGSTLNINGRTVFSKEFPLGEGWYSITPRINIAVVIGSGSGAIAESELLFIKNILLRTDRNEELVNAPARFIYKVAAAKMGSPPRKDAMAAATATYRVSLPTYFVDNKLFRPEDTILDTSRYGSITLDIQLGTVADLFTTVGTSSVTATLDLEIQRSKGYLPPEAQPFYHINNTFTPPVDAASQTFIDMERSPDLSIKRFYAHACSGGTAGQPFSGANADDVQSVESFQDQNTFIIQKRIHEMIQNQNKDDYSLESVLAGFTIFDFVADGSIISSLVTGDTARLQYLWDNKAGVASGDLVTLGYEGIRLLR